MTEWIYFIVYELPSKGIKGNIDILSEREINSFERVREIVSVIANKNSFNADEVIINNIILLGRKND